MKLKFKHQKFQAEAAKAVCDVFQGQPNIDSSEYLMDKGYVNCELKQKNIFEGSKELERQFGFTGFMNAPLIPVMNSVALLENLNNVQRINGIEQSKNFEGLNFTVEMETGVGKTYTYIKTMFELYKHYGWTKFIIVVPSIAIREGVFKSFQTTQEHFAEVYGKKIKFFIYDSSRLNEIEQFANDGGLNVMIINSQAFNARGKDARRIYMKLDNFRSRRPIDIISSTNPILIIDEPQSVEGAATKERLKEFNPLFTLRYSATPKERYNLVYRLDAIEAYNKKLVKKIAVKGVTVSDSDGTRGYVYVQGINLFKDKPPVAVMEFDYKFKNGIRKVIKKLSEGDNLYEKSGNLDEYKNGYTITEINVNNNTVEFLNGLKINVGNLVGEINEDEIRRIQIRETILSHLQRERKLFYKGIKVLSLFFIDEVSKYKQYDDDNNELNGVYAKMFEEEYDNIIHELQLNLGEDNYIEYLRGFTPEQTHAGYFSIDKKTKRIRDSKENRKEGGVQDVDAFDLIMKNKERLLSFEEPVRFIFSHSALREGWDNPNVFQICTLKKSSKEDKKRQEIGRGLRLCVNQQGERMDSVKLGEQVHDTNILTVIANESYAEFTENLQNEIAELIADRPKEVNEAVFINKVLSDGCGNTLTVDIELAKDIMYELTVNRYVDRKGLLTDTYYEAKSLGKLIFPEGVKGFEESIINILDKIYDSNILKPTDEFNSRVQIELDMDKLNSKEFQNLWNNINSKSVYTVEFDTDELVKNSIESINNNLFVSEFFSLVEQGSMDMISSKESLIKGESFGNSKKSREKLKLEYRDIKYDLIGKVVEATGLTRSSIVKVLKGIKEDKFKQFGLNPEDFILKVSQLINEEKASVIIKHIKYIKSDSKYSSDIFVEYETKSVNGQNIIPTKKNLYNYLVYDSIVEKDFAESLESNSEVSMYVKLPKSFYINTPVGHYNPDWAIAFNHGFVKNICFVAETKGSLSNMQLKPIEKAKIECAKRHFEEISSDSVRYDVVDNYESLLNKVLS